MQYVGQTCRKLKNRFGEHYRKINKPKKIDNFLYQHFKRTGHSPDNILVQPVEKWINDENSSVRFNTIKRLEKSNRKAMNRIWSNQKANPALKPKREINKYYK